ncbi:Dntt protein, partial [Triplophysa rosa]
SLCVCVCLCRGKDFGHDVDFIIRTPEPGQEDGLLPALIDRFRRQV